MKYLKLAKLLQSAGFTPRTGKGDHEVWKHTVGITISITVTRECSAGITDKALKAIKRAKEGK
jgi:predicted RNA binding protein YcfA (HicA-like mRNA interferase family)